VLLALARLARDKAEPNPEGGPPVVTEPKRIAGIGLVDAPVEAVTAAVSKAGLAGCSRPYGMLGSQQLAVLLLQMLACHMDIRCNMQ
jgi:hypothetical protein